MAPLRTWFFCILVASIASVSLDHPAQAVTAASRDEAFTHASEASIYRPLPFQTDEAIERFLAEAVVVSTSKIPVGVSDPRKLLLARDGLHVNAIFKDIDREEKRVRDGSKFYLSWHDWYGYDVAAYRLDRLLGLDRVPPVVERKIQRNPGSVQIWLEGVVTDTVRREEGHKPPSIGRFNQQK